MPKIMKVDFYRLHQQQDNHIELEGILLNIARARQGEDRNVDVGTTPIRLQEISQSDSLIDGDMMKIRMDEVPLKVKLNGEAEAIDLDDDEGIGEETAFLFDPATQVLALQRNRYGVSIGALSSYIEQIGRIEAINFDPVITEEGIRKLERYRDIRTFSFGIAGLERVRVFEREGFGLEMMNDLARIYQAPSVTINMSMSHHGGSLVMHTIRQAIRRLLRASRENEANIKKIVLKGRDQDGDPLLVDILEDRMVEYGEISLDEHRHALYTDRRNILREAFQHRRREIRTLFARPE